MPVNEKNGSGEMLEQGWRRMQGVLDQEMPISNKQWGIWIPLSVVGFAILVMTGIYFSQEKEAKTAPVEQTNPHQSFAQSESGAATTINADGLQDVSGVSAEIGVAENSAVGKSDAGKTIANKAVERSTIELNYSEESLSKESLTQESLSNNISRTDHSTDEISTTDNIGIDVAYNAKLSKKSVGNENVGKGSEGKADAGKTGVGKVSATTSKIIENDALSGSDIPLLKLNNRSNQYAAIEDNTQIAAYDVVAISTIDAVDIVELNEGPLAAPVIVVAPKVRPRIGLDAYFAPHFSAPVQLQGYEFGALATVSIGKKWKVMSGASFGHYNKSGVLQFGGLSQDLKAEALFVPTIADTSTINYPGNSPEVDYDLIGYDTAQLLTEVLNYLHIPVLGQYRISNFLSVIGGVKFSYLINAPTSRGLSAFPSTGSSPGTFDLQSSRNFLAEENILRSWDIAPVIGLALNVGARLALDVQYQHGMIAYVDRPTEGDRSDYQRTLSIGLRYSFF